MDLKELGKLNLIFKKVKYLGEHDAESYHITAPKEFDTIAMYVIDDNGHEHFLAEIEPSDFRELVLNYLRRKI